MTPFKKSKYQLCINSDSKFDYLELKPNESVVVNLLAEGSLTPGENDMLQFSLRMSLYNEPVTYEIKFTNDDDSLMSQFQTSQIDYKTLVK